MHEKQPVITTIPHIGFDLLGASNLQNLSLCSKNEMGQQPIQNPL